MGRFFGWKLGKHINIPNFYSGQYHKTIFHDTYFSDCIFSFIFWQKSLILWISSKKVLRGFFKILKNLCLRLRSFFLNPKILRLHLRSIFDLRCNTGTWASGFSIMCVIDTRHLVIPSSTSIVLWLNISPLHCSNWV